MHLSPTVYVYDQAAVTKALAEEDDIAFYIDTRDMMAMKIRKDQHRATEVGPAFDGTVGDLYCTISQPDWIWVLNANCKYVLVYKSKGVVRVADRNHQPITLTDLRRQHGRQGNRISTSATTGGARR